MCHSSPITLPVSSGSRAKRTISSIAFERLVHGIAAERAEAPGDVAQAVGSQFLPAHGDDVVAVEHAA